MELMNKTLGGVLHEAAQRMGDAEMIKYTLRDYRRTWREFDEESDLIARAFMALGVDKGDHVAIWANNIPEWILTLYACAKTGAVLVTVNTAYKVFELEYLLRQSDSKLLVMGEGYKDSSYPAIVYELCPSMRASRIGEFVDVGLPRFETCIYCGTGDQPGMLNFKRLYDIAETVSPDALARRQATLSPDDVVNMQYTSGTTGFPKGVMLTHKNILNNGRSIGDCMKLTEKDKLCITVPFFHCFGLVLAMMAALTHDTSIVPIDYFRPVWVMDALQSERCTAVHGVPTMYIAMLEHKDFAKYKFNLRTGIMAGSPCPVEVMKKVVSEMGMREITISYGQTEASPVCTMTTTDDSLEHRVSTVGRALPAIECKIVDPETGADSPDGVPGEFVARGYNIMRGYYNMPEATALAIDTDGWLHSGDLATRDEKGYYKITGRIKDMIIRGGENIYPKEIEEFLYTQDAISDVQVIGVPSRQYGEEIMACIILKQGCSMTEDEVKVLVAANMARHKVPRYVAFVDSFPLTASGKIQKYKMRDWAVKLLGLEDEADIETA
ncbi:MAG: AMP-binding protein [Oscillospiraceae bacterium]|nr:AMP-binding protein [Oscillospiraceae bacterium]